jgi:hypothetical protein
MRKSLKHFHHPSMMAEPNRKAKLKHKIFMPATPLVGLTSAIEPNTIQILNSVHPEHPQRIFFFTALPLQHLPTHIFCVTTFHRVMRF